jgi:hypothetical protein
MTLRRSVGTVLAALLLMSGCRSEQPSSPSTEQTATETPTTLAVTSTSTSAPSEPILKRRDAPPTGVAAQADFFIGGGADCPDRPPSRPSIQLFSQQRQGSRMEIPDSAMICFYGLSTDTPLNVELRYPSGVVDRFPLDGLAGPDGYGFPFVRLPGDPLGRHTVVGRQGRERVTLNFEVAPADQRQIELLSPIDLYPGGYVRVAIGGFEPERPVRLHLYRREETAPEGPFRYQTSLTVPTDANGAALQILPTTPDDPPGCYGIQVNTQLSTANGFCLRRLQPAQRTVLVILASKPTEREARAELLKLQHRNRLRLSGLVVEPSSEYPLLKPGFWIVHLPFPDVEQAQRVVQELRGEVPGIYAKRAMP